jgi:hypothetical protein
LLDNKTTCPICRHDLCHAYATGGHKYGYDCFICGRFEIAREAFDDYLAPGRLQFDIVQRAVLSYRLRTSSSQHRLITGEWLLRVRSEGKLPTPTVQVANLIALIGEHVSQTGTLFMPDESTYARIGSVDDAATWRWIRELLNRKLVVSPGSGERQGFAGGRVVTAQYDLTLDGWERYEAERDGQVAGRYGFLAMKFNDPALESFSREVVKPAVKDGIGFELIDVRDVSQAGIIDNILRSTIRDAAFVLVDLTHDNYGAYWEAGYAEGLGKPVIYLSERAKFEVQPSHFDTNHCTTVMWGVDEPDAFARELTATLRRSLNLF